MEEYEKQFLTPLDQTDRDVKPEFIQCNIRLVLIQKIDDMPSCVKPDRQYNNTISYELSIILIEI